MSEVLEIEIDKIDQDPEQPRVDFDQGSIEDLALNIKAVGLAQPITVRPNNKFPGRYYIVAGERRYRACRLIEKDTISAIVNSDIKGEDLKYMQLSENLFRDDLNPVELALYLDDRLAQLIKSGYGRKAARDKLKEQLGIKDAWLSKKLGFLKFRLEIIELAKNNKIRDYSTLKKLNDLDETKLAMALEEIKLGVFNAKEFFNRKASRTTTAKKTTKAKPFQHRWSIDRPTIDAVLAALTELSDQEISNLSDGDAVDHLKSIKKQQVLEETAA